MHERDGAGSCLVTREEEMGNEESLGDVEAIVCVCDVLIDVLNSQEHENVSFL